jgi:hypothetical protein
MELRLKRYRILKLYGLKCKISELEIDFLLNWGLNRNLLQAQGVLCKTAGLIRILIYFYKGKTVDRVHGLWTAQGWSVHGSTMDLTVVSGRSSPELSPPVATVSEKSPRMEKHGAGGAVMVGGRWWGNKLTVASSHGHEAWNREK